MELYLLRHAVAVERGTPGFEDDSQRPLTPAGARKMRRIASGMAALGLRVNAVLSSPYLRARETADIAARALLCRNGVEVSPHLAPDGSITGLLQMLNARDLNDAGVLLVGHEPCLSELASLLMAGHADACWLDLKKGGLCKLAVDAPLRPGQCATLEWWLAPRHLVALAR